jgi:hypothetical protein
MTTTILSIWTIIALLLALLVVRRLFARRSDPGEGAELDDAAIARILSHGTLSTAEDEPLDEEEIARAESEFWEESWDDPEEYGR